MKKRGRKRITYNGEFHHREKGQLVFFLHLHTQRTSLQSDQVLKVKIAHHMCMQSVSVNPLDSRRVEV